jgi:putative thioredoxin
MTSILPLGAASAPAPDLIKDSGIKTFAADVIEASRKGPVIVDFWAPWCGPCKQLTPILEKAVRAAGGAVKLVKINIDDNPELAQHLRIQSVPTVYGFKNGQPVDGFAGALPESQVKAFIERLAGPVGPSPAEALISEADEMVKRGEIAGAAQLFAGALQEEPGEPRAIAGLARCYLKNGDLVRARQTLELAPPEARKHQAIASLQAELELASTAKPVIGTSSLEAAIAADPKNLQARFDLALARIASGERERAMDELLEIVRRERKWNEEAARKQLLTLFEALGPTDPLTIAGRRRLSSILFA